MFHCLFFPKPREILDRLSLLPQHCCCRLRVAVLCVLTGQEVSAPSVHGGGCVHVLTALPCVSFPILSCRLFTVSWGCAPTAAMGIQ